MELLYFGIWFLAFSIVYFQQQQRNRAIKRARHDRECLRIRRLVVMQQEKRRIRQRRQRNIMAILAFQSERRPCSIWCMPRSKHWWEAVQAGSFGRDWWKENLRLSQATFTIICNELRCFIARNDTNLRLSISVEERVVITIWKLATNIEYRTLSELFGIGRLTVCEIVNDTCQQIVMNLLPKYVKVPKGDRLKEVVDGFELTKGFPQAVGAIDGTHIPIIRPEQSPEDYYNRKGYYLIIMQGLVDFRGIFMDVCIGWPGKVHDARVFSNSEVYKKGMQGTLLPDWKKEMSGVQVPLLILGNPAYPALPWLMKPYAVNPHTTAEQQNFNYHQSRTRMVVENAFGRLKGRWRCLLKRLDMQIDNATTAVGACVVLHNICEMFGDHCLEGWEQINPDEDQFLSAQNDNDSSRQGASTIRDAIKNYLIAH